MSRLLEIAMEIQDWLSGLQVRQRTIETEVQDGSLRFSLEHPVSGTIEVQERLRENEFFQSHGIALRTQPDTGPIHTIEVYDHGGIFDPIDGRVQGEHYSTSHYALLSAILYQELGEENYLHQACEAIEFHLRTSPDEYRFSEWMYHWDFQNYAFVLTYAILKPYLSVSQERHWADALMRWHTNRRNKLTNWAAMRAWAFQERYRLLGRTSDILRYWPNINTVRRARRPDGCFDDNPGLSRPIQYHVFTVAVLHRIYLLNRSGMVKRWFDNGIEYLLPFIDPDGDFNYLGRGQEQIFGYGAAVYALEAAYQMSRNRRFLELSDSVCSHLSDYKVDGHFPLVLNRRPDWERNGWYDYHHVTVYNAFLGVWLGLAHLLGNPPARRKRERVLSTTFFRPTQSVVVSKERYFTVFSGGLTEYSSEPAVTPHHLWWQGVGRVFSCPGGPSGGLHGSRSPRGSERNVFAPVARVDGAWMTPAKRRAQQFDLVDQRLNMTLDYGPFTLRRAVTLGKESVEFADEFIFSRSQKYEELRVFNLPVATDGLRVEVLDGGRLCFCGDEGALEIAIEACDFPEAEFERLELLKVACGEVRILAKRYRDMAFQGAETRHIRFTVRGQSAKDCSTRDESSLHKLSV